VSQEELDLFDFAARGMAQLCAGPTQIMWSEAVQLDPFRTLPNDVADDILGDTFSPWRSLSANGPEDPALTNLGGDDPTIDRLFNPRTHGHSFHTAAFANQVDNGPVSLPDLHVFHFQG
jgi:hypothetical protein